MIQTQQHNNYFGFLRGSFQEGVKTLIPKNVVGKKNGL
jgi:hypothetical protein